MIAPPQLLVLANQAMPTTARLVSIVVPAFNAERFLGSALSSICAQSYRAIEVIVCDDASTDRTPDVVRALRDPRIRYLRNECTLGAYAAANRGVRDSQGEFVAVYQADGVYDPGIVDRERAFLQAHTDAGAVFCLDRFLDAAGREYDRLRVPPAIAAVELFDTAFLAEHLLRFKNTFLRTPSVMLRRSAFDAVNGFDQERFGIAADLDMWVRLSLDHRVGLIHGHLMGYRHYPGQWSKQSDWMRTDPEMFFVVMDRHLSRPGVRALVSDEALTCYRVWRVQDDAERAANAFVLGDRQKAVALLNGSLVRPLLRSRRRSQVARVLALRAIVRAAAAGGQRARGLVHFARFRRLLPHGLAPPAASTAHSLDPSAAAVPTTAAIINGDTGRQTPRVRVFLDPFTRHFHGNQLFDPRSRFNRDGGALRPWFRLRERLATHGIPLDTGDYLTDDVRGRSRGGTSIYCSFGIHDAYRPLLERDDVLLNAFYLFEVVAVDPVMYRATPELAKHFRSIYSWTGRDQLRPFVPDVPEVTAFRIPMPFEHVLEPHWSRTDRAGIVLVNSNKRAVLSDGELYTERLRALKHFAGRGGIDLWGRLWENGLGALDAEFGEAVRGSWRGPVDDKYEALSRYRFAICYENMTLDGWITEKLFDCLYAGVVPIYLGAPDIAAAVDPECFIDARQFASYDEMERYLFALSPAECVQLRMAGRDYIASSRFRQFSRDAFADRFIADLEAQLREHGLAHLWG